MSQIALRAALTGHLVLSTLHTNSASETVVRLEDMGVPGYLLASALVMIIAQRLVRRLCGECCVPYSPTPAEIQEFSITEAQLARATFKKEKGCNKCGDKGFRGRAAVYEILELDFELKEMVRKSATASELNDVAVSKGMKLLYQAGVEKAAQGITTLSRRAACSPARAADTERRPAVGTPQRALTR